MNLPRQTRALVILGLAVLVLGSGILHAQKRRTSRTNNKSANANKAKPATSNNSTAEKEQLAQDSDGSSATVRETLQWLGEKLATEGGYRKDGEKGLFKERKYVFIRAAGCTIVVDYFWKSFNRYWISESQFSSEPRASESSYRYEFSMADLEPLSLKMDHYSDDDFMVSTKVSLVSFKTFNNRPRIKVVTRSSGSSELISGFAFEFSNEDVAKRVLRAMQHAIKLCGGKVEPF